MKVYLEFTNEKGKHEIELVGEKFSLGRGGDVDYRIDDQGLSRVNSVFYQEDSKVWIVDQNSTNGTFVNGSRVGANGAPIEHGDTIKVGNHTNLYVSFEPDDYSTNEGDRELASNMDSDSNAKEGFTSSSGNTESKEKLSPIIPIAIIGVALMIIIGTGTVIAFVVISGNSGEISDASPTFDDLTEDSELDNTISTSSNSEDSLGADTTESQQDSSDLPSNSITNSPTSGGMNSDNYSTGGKLYQQMSDPEKNRYVKAKAEKVARTIGNKSSESIPPAAIAQIRRFLDSYVTRIRASSKNDCSGGGWLSSDMGSVLGRARRNAPFIIRAFNQKGIDPQVGLYLAMIESEHCPCLQSSTGPLGMFQFTKSTGEAHGLATRSGASPSNPDERCEPTAAANAAASYMKTLTGRIGTGPLSIPLAIASYNSGEGGLGKNLRIALEANESQERSFWTLVANSDKLASQFQRENIKYVPKFFAAAIIGENPKDFGINLYALSTYSK